MGLKQLDSPSANTAITNAANTTDVGQTEVQRHGRSPA